MWYWRIFDWMNQFGFEWINEFFEVANPGKTKPAKGR